MAGRAREIPIQLRKCTQSQTIEAVKTPGSGASKDPGLASKIDKINDEFKPQNDPQKALVSPRDQILRTLEFAKGKNGHSKSFDKIKEDEPGEIFSFALTFYSGLQKDSRQRMNGCLTPAAMIKLDQCLFLFQEAYSAMSDPNDKTLAAGMILEILVYQGYSMDSREIREWSQRKYTYTGVVDAFGNLSGSNPILTHQALADVLFSTGDPYNAMLKYEALIQEAEQKKSSGFTLSAEEIKAVKFAARKLISDFHQKLIDELIKPMDDADTRKARFYLEEINQFSNRANALGVYPNPRENFKLLDQLETTLKEAEANQP